MLKNIFAFFVFALLTILSIQPAFAGGGPVSLQAFALQPFDQTHAFIVQTDTYTADGDCSSFSNSIGLLDTVENDSVTPFTPPADGTYLQRHFSDGNGISTWLSPLCTTYTKVISGEKRQRTFTETVTIHGTQHQRGIQLSFGDDEYSKQIQSYGRYNNYDNLPIPDVYEQAYKGSDKREVKIQWNKIAWATKYAVFTNEVTGANTTPPPTLVTTTENTQVILTLPASANISISVMACKADDSCTTRKDNMYGSFHLNKMTNVVINNKPPSIKPSLQTPSLTPIAKTTVFPTVVSDKKIAELNEKVANLEGKLQVSEAKQSILEQKINDLITFIKRLFPLFQ